MAMSAPRASVFTFESTVHSSHVLRCLDDQRRRDVLCDVTLVVEGRSFRAHRSVLASCSEYFTHRTSCLSPHGAVVTLPREVTVAGFEPLLKFAYTSKLLFGKDSVLEIRNAASVLGFRDLDEACFDFLLPKFFSSGGGSSKGSLPFPRKTCCKKKNKRPLSKEDCSTDSDAALLDEKEAKPVADSTSQQEVAVRCEKSERGKTGSPNTKGTTTPVAEGAKDNFTQCPKYRKFQLACGKDACGAEKSLSSLATVIRDECEPSCSPCSSQNETAQANPAGLSSDGADEPRKTEIHDKKTEGGVAGGGVRAAQRDTNEREDGTKTEEEMMAQTAGASSPDRSRVKAVPVGESTVPGERSPGSIMHRCPLRALAGGPAMTRSWGQERFVCMGLKEDKKPRDSCVVEPVSIRQNAGERVEAEGKRAENAWEERGEEGPVGITEKGTLPVNPAREGSADVGSPQPISQAPDAGRSSDAAGVQVQSSSLEWLKLHVDLAASGGAAAAAAAAAAAVPSSKSWTRANARGRARGCPSARARPTRVCRP
uniref:BTB domain-containing protein n=1 Tax=Scophthalmus maximus TaxID=52904 RepID=A0A8D3B5M9_SCOMX